MNTQVSLREEVIKNVNKATRPCVCWVKSCQVKNNDKTYFVGPRKITADKYTAGWLMHFSR
jgi:hypothetical protein